MTLDQLPTGSRLLVRSKTTWRFAAVSRIIEETVVLTVSSPKGCNYRLRRGKDTEINTEGIIPVLNPSDTEDWRENFMELDRRW